MVEVRCLRFGIRCLRFGVRCSGLEKLKDLTNCEAALSNESKLNLLNPKPFNLNVLISPLCVTKGDQKNLNLLNPKLSKPFNLKVLINSQNSNFYPFKYLQKDDGHKKSPWRTTGSQLTSYFC